jgi:hypothetical protein
VAVSVSAGTAVSIDGFAEVLRRQGEPATRQSSSVCGHDPRGDVAGLAGGYGRAGAMLTCDASGATLICGYAGAMRRGDVDMRQNRNEKERMFFQ